METFFNCSVAWYSKDSLGAASDLYLREKDLIAEITACCSIFPPSSVFKQERGCFCELQITQIEEINELGVFSSIGICTWQKKFLVNAKKWDTKSFPQLLLLASIFILGFLLTLPKHVKKYQFCLR